jgi:hypothetical protein
LRNKLSSQTISYRGTPHFLLFLRDINLNSRKNGI